MFTEQYGEEAAQEYVFHLSDDIKGKFGHVIEDTEEAVKNALTYFGSFNRLGAYITHHPVNIFLKNQFLYSIKSDDCIARQASVL